MSTAVKRLLGALAVLGVGGAMVAAWLLGLFTAEPDEVSLADAVAIETRAAEEAAEAPETSMPPTSTTPGSVATTQAEKPTATEDDPSTSVPATVTTTGPAPTTPSAPIVDDTGIAGAWTVVPGEATFVGYRARGRSGVGVGRSPAVTGTLVATAESIVEVDVVADLTQLKSDSSLRDDHLGDDGLETRTYPTSTFRLVEPMKIPNDITEGEELAFAAVGDLTVRDVTNRETIELQGALVGGRLVVVGSLGVVLDDYGASIGGTDRATMEFSLVFDRTG